MRLSSIFFVCEAGSMKSTCIQRPKSNSKHSQQHSQHSAFHMSSVPFLCLSSVFPLSSHCLPSPSRNTTPYFHFHSRAFPPSSVLLTVSQNTLTSIGTNNGHLSSASPPNPYHLRVIGHRQILDLTNPLFSPSLPQLFLCPLSFICSRAQSPIHVAQALAYPNDQTRI
ncbi:hypothetical protein GQ43DRAFT_141627 [Delitschia confertaspora ATCC 74209]|uniref:Uncharacterized protein n=1 Tax=Delitschia confertaspora ATCC 74209 TaxID=1513339 RepID=A0A9P4MW03_9PLEO|nr:hypothetical protein GQ43DRAFT_141627 [Delitschia confertaspora ATCC 74209]